MQIIWDVGHQAYGHKILTGRRHRMHTIRQTGGLSGFTKREESEYDPFGAGHSSTSVSAALGMAVGRDFKARSAPEQISIMHLSCDMICKWQHLYVGLSCFGGFARSAVDSINL